MRYSITVVPLLLSGCATLYPVGGAILGGGAGSLAGPFGAAMGERWKCDHLVSGEIDYDGDWHARDPDPPPE
jgi:hypothetical protein